MKGTRDEKHSNDSLLQGMRSWEMMLGHYKKKTQLCTPLQMSYSLSAAKLKHDWLPLGLYLSSALCIYKCVGLVNPRQLNRLLSHTASLEFTYAFPWWYILPQMFSKITIHSNMARVLLLFSSEQRYSHMRLYCCPDCPSCPANTIQMGCVIWAER